MLAYKENLRLNGHQRYPEFHGNSVRRSRYYRVDEDIIVLHYSRECELIDAENRIYSTPVGVMDTLLSPLNYEHSLHRRNMWNTVRDMFLTHGHLIDTIISPNHADEFIFTVPVTHHEIFQLDASADKSKKQRGIGLWFRWAQIYYDPAWLYTLQHDKEYRFHRWCQLEELNGSQMSEGRRLLSKKGTISDDFELRKCREITHFCIRGETPKTFKFPHEYRAEKFTTPRKTARKKKVIRNGRKGAPHLTIVKDPDHLGYVKEFKWYFFHPSHRQWVYGGLVQANTDAKSWVSIPVSCITQRIRIQATDIVHSGDFHIEIWGVSETAEDVSVDEGQTLAYRVMMPRKKELTHISFKGGASRSSKPYDSWIQPREPYARHAKRRMTWIAEEINTADDVNWDD